jgi:cobalt-zinc-cadmium efflux system protein
MHDHGHGHALTEGGSRLFWVMLLNVGITVAQVVGGLVSGSLALLSDAVHNGSDVAALAVAWAAARIKRRPPTAHYTFGMKRVEILAAIFNAATLIGISVFLAVEALERLRDPPPVSPGVVIALAGLGLAINSASAWILQGEAHGNLNVRAAWLHLAGDAATSAAVLAGGLAMLGWGLWWLDPAITLAISAWLLHQSWRIVRSGMDVVLMAVPPSLSLEEIRSALAGLPGVEDIHHVHLWQLDGTQIHFEAHVRVAAETTVADTDRIRDAIARLLHDRFGIEHVTLQFESRTCAA